MATLTKKKSKAKPYPKGYKPKKLNRPKHRSQACGICSIRGHNARTHSAYVKSVGKKPKKK